MRETVPQGADLVFDLGQALRRLKRVPGFSVAVLLTLGLGIGASTLIFAIVNSVVLRPLPFDAPDRLIAVRLSTGARISEAYLQEWRLDNSTLEDLAGWFDARASLTGGGPAVEVDVDHTTDNFFSVLRVQPILGRAFSPSRDLSNAEPEAVISFGLWRRRFGTAPDVVGRNIVLDQRSHRVIGVMPEGFAVRTNELAESRAEVWTPFALKPRNRAGMGGALNVIGRLRPGAEVHQAQADLTRIARALEEQYPSYSRDWKVEVMTLREATVRDVRGPLTVLFGAVNLLLLLASFNVANLSLGRSRARRAEMAIRLSLGASRRRIVSQVFSETLVLTLVGGVLGTLLAFGGVRVAASLLPPELEVPRLHGLGVDPFVLGFACLLTLLAGMVSGLLPALSVARSAANSTMTDVVRLSSPIRMESRATAFLIGAEVAMALVLVSGAFLLGRSFWTLTRVEPGFQPEHVLTFRVTLPEARYSSRETLRVFETELRSGLEGLPGVEAVGSANYLPLSGGGMADHFEIAGQREGRDEGRKTTWINTVGGRYFEVMKIPLLRGRYPRDSDSAASPPVFVIDQGLAAKYWPGKDPLGQRLVFDTGGAAISGEIIGIVAPVRTPSLSAEAPPMTYGWLPQAPPRELSFVVRTSAAPETLGKGILGVVGRLDGSLPVSDLRPLGDFVAADRAQRRFTAMLLGGFALAALVLAGLGLYAVIALAVSERTREIAVRVVLGADGRSILGLVMSRGAVLIASGLLAGVVGALALGNAVSGLLYGVAPRDPATLAAATLFLGAVALLAMYVPARRALRIDPIIVLRTE